MSNSVRLQARNAIEVLAWLPVLLFFTENVGSVATISGRSMQPTFNPDASALRRDVVLLDRWSVATALPYNLGDIVTLWSPSSPNTLSSKRIIALEGDIVTTLSPYPEKKVLIPKGHCWVEGDEPFHSRDSNSYGPIPLGLINAKVSRIIWPYWRMGPLPPIPPSALNRVRRKSNRSFKVVQPMYAQSKGKRPSETAPR